MFPWLAYGHIAPYLQVAKFLAQKNHHIYYVSTPKNISRLPQLPPTLCSNITFIPLSLPHVDGLPPGVESTSELPIHKVPYLKKSFDKLETQLTEFLERSPQIKLIIHDFAPYWLPPMANQLRINLVCFSIFNASSNAFLGSTSEMLGGSRKSPEDFTVVPTWMDYPNNIAFKLHETFSHKECEDIVSDVERYATVLLNCKILTLRTCYEFEPEALRVLGKIHQKPIVPLGLLSPSLSNIEDKGDENWKALKKWLDSKQEKSVFYVALGSEVSLSQQSMHELAFGIEKSGLPFIWVVRKPPLVEEQFAEVMIPPEFEERVSKRGMVLRGWAPQLRILAHSSVGGFLTHCGWSSVIESLGLGKPLILFPGGSADLGLIARLMHWKKVGFEIERNDVDGSFKSDLVAACIKRVMVDPEGEQLRANALAMKEIFGNVELSNKCLDEFTQLIENITFVEFSLPQVDGLPPGVESTAEVPIENVPYLKNAYDKLQGPLTEFLKNSNVNWIIHDFEPYWLPGVAAPLGINLVLFCLFNATALAFLGPPSALLGEFRKRPEEFTVVPEWIDYPCNIALKHHEIVNHIKCMDDVSDFQRMGQLIQGSQFVTTRACFEFEPDEIKLLIKLYQKPVVPVGLLPPSLPSNEDKRDDKWGFLNSLWLELNNRGTQVWPSFDSVFWGKCGSGVER
ncbi:hypothetical protein ES332_A05G034600v1 [Gossypium tomentosum]|nr:hypothetical protein ES332_A05G034600v1 [Gossypium tomentosum]